MGYFPTDLLNCVKHYMLSFCNLNLILLYSHWFYFLRGEGESHIDFKAMIICLALHLLLLMFEIFVCVNLGGGRHFPWRLMFMPLYVLSSLSIIACVWGFRHDRSVEVSSYKMQMSSS